MVSEPPVSAAQDTVLKTVCDRFAAIADTPTENLDLDAHLVEVYGLDSIRALKLISDIEVEFDIDIAQEEARQICTLNDVIALIHAKSGQA
jgi:acyl carrier protein